MPSVPVTARKRGRPRNLEPSDEYRQRLEIIVTKAAEVFKAQGYEAGSLEDVAAALGMSKASLYYYVKSKSHLLGLVFDRAISAALREIDALASDKDPRVRLAALVRHQAHLVVGDPALFGVFFDQRAGLRADDLAELVTKERRYVRQFVVAVEAAMKAGVIASGDPRVVSYCLIGMTSWSYKWFDPDRDTAESFADACIALVLPA
jgi:TetR/AcrR family transcriptional regulator, cholesterol catabolism regulator